MKRKLPLFLTGCLMLCALAPALAACKPEIEYVVMYESVLPVSIGGTVADVVEAVADSVVEISTETVTTGSFMQQFITTGAGSGVIVSSNGMIVTNNHVIEGAKNIKVRLRNGKEYDATYISRDAVTDIGVIKITPEGELRAAAWVSDSDRIRVGETAVVIGNPLGRLGGTVSCGIVSAVSREIYVDGVKMTLMQTDASVNPGNSGGGMFNLSGQLIGIINAKSVGGDIEGIGFAIPANVAKPICAELIEKGYVTGRTSLGLEIVQLSAASALFNGFSCGAGLYVSAVKSGGCAEEAGFRVRDFIGLTDGKAFRESAAFKNYIDGKSVGDTIKFTVIRGEKTQTLNLTLAQYYPTQ